MKISVYQECKKRLIDQINQSQLELRVLDRMMKNTCTHPTNKLHRRTNNYEDETGRYVSEWSDYTYSCTRCGESFDSKVLLKDKQIKEGLKNE